MMADLNENFAGIIGTYWFNLDTKGTYGFLGTWLMF